MSSRNKNGCSWGIVLRINDGFIQWYEVEVEITESILIATTTEDCNSQQHITGSRCNYW